MKKEYRLTGYIKRPCLTCGEDRDCLVLVTTDKKTECVCKECVDKRELNVIK